MASTAVTAEERTVSGTSASRKLRSQGFVPAVVYGHKEAVAHIKLSVDEIDKMLREGHKVIDLSVGGNAEKCIVKEMQWDTFQENVLHVDFVRVSKGELIIVEVPVHVHGDAVGVLNGGVLEQPHHTVEVEVPALQTPDEIVVDVSELKIGDSFTVADLKLPENVRCTLPEDTPIVSIAAPTKAIEPDTEEGAAEPEVIGEQEDGGDETPGAEVAT